MPCKRLVVHYNRLKPYHPPFNTDVYGPDYKVQSEGDSVHEPLTDKRDVPEPQELEVETTDGSDSQQLPEQSETPRESSPSPSLRRSHRTRRPPDRYGQCVSYPDCYTSNSDSD